MRWPALMMRRAGLMASSSELAIFFVFCSIFLFTVGGRLYNIDEIILFRVTQSIAESGTVAIEPLPGMPSFHVARGRDDLFYTSKAPGVSLATVPLYLLGRSFGEAVAPQPELWYTYRFLGAEVGASLLNVPISAATAALLFALARGVGYRTTTRWLITVLWGLGTMAWVYASKSMETEPMETLGVAAASYAALRFRGEGRWAALIGVSLGVASLARPVHLVLVLPFGVYLLFRLRKGNHQPRTWLGAIFAFGIGMGAFVVPVALYNWYRFGNPLETGHALAFGAEYLPYRRLPDLAAGWHLLTSPGKGLFWYAPPALLGILGLRGFIRKWPDYGWLLIATVAIIFTITICWGDPYGGWSWGPKFLQPAVPLLILLGGAALPSEPGGGKLPWLAVIVLLVVSVLISFLGVAADYVLWYLYVEAMNPLGVVHELVFFDSRWWPILGHAELLMQEGPDFFWNRAFYMPYGAGEYFLRGFWWLWGVSLLPVAGIALARAWSLIGASRAGPKGPASPPLGPP